MRPASPARWLRAAGLAGSSVGLAAGAHFLAGGHADPVFLALLLATATVASYHWTKRERNLLTIVAAVLAVQAVVHVTLGHAHSGRSMLGAHVAAALLLALFLRIGEARLHAAARRRYLRWIVALRLALAGTLERPAVTRGLLGEISQLRDVWIDGTAAGRGPPVPAAL